MAEHGGLTTKRKDCIMALFMSPDGAVYDIPIERLHAYRLEPCQPDPHPEAAPFEDEDGPDVRMADRELTSDEIEQIESALRRFAHLLGR
jgi:hypothetical protein